MSWQIEKLFRDWSIESHGASKMNADDVPRAPLESLQAIFTCHFSCLIEIILFLIPFG
jgi:hypothetical protein